MNIRLISSISILTIIFEFCSCAPTTHKLIYRIERNKITAYQQYDSANEKVYNHNEVDTPPKPLKWITPRWPKELKKYEGRVKVRFVITKQGKMRDVEIIQSIPHGVFDQVVLEALKEYQYKPATKDGKPVGCAITLPIEFQNKGIVSTFDALKDVEKGSTYINKVEYDKAIEAFTEAINIDDHYSPAYSGRGLVYGNQGKYEAAILDFGKAIRLDPENEMYFKLRGKVYTEMQKFQKAIEDYSNAIKLKPNMADAYFARGEAFRGFGKYSEAIADYTKAIELDKSYIQAYDNRAVAYSKLNDTENMCLDLKKACDLSDCRWFDYVKKTGKCSADTAVSHVNQ